MPASVWILISAGTALLMGLVVSLGWWWLRHRPPATVLHTEGALTTRPLFNPRERLLFRLLCDALPHHVVLAKMQLIRFCRPVDPAQVREWHDLLGPIYVTFVVCAPSGQVLAAIDVVEDRRQPSPRITTLKEDVLQACRIRYVRCRADQFPSVSELQMLVPQQGTTGRASVPHTVEVTPGPAGTTLAHTVRARRRGQAPRRWHDLVLHTDSFFAPDSRSDDFAPTDTLDLTPAPPAPAPESPVDDKEARKPG